MGSFHLGGLIPHLIAHWDDLKMEEIDLIGGSKLKPLAWILPMQGH
jgi:hypothetical protein